MPSFLPFSHCVPFSPLVPVFLPLISVSYCSFAYLPFLSPFSPLVPVFLSLISVSYCSFPYLPILSPFSPCVLVSKLSYSYASIIFSPSLAVSNSHPHINLPFFSLFSNPPVSKLSSPYKFIIFSFSAIFLFPNSHPHTYLPFFPFLQSSCFKTLIPLPICNYFPFLQSSCFKTLHPIITLFIVLM